MPRSAVAKSTVETLFVTRLYRSAIAARGGASFNHALARTCLGIAAEDSAGRRWAKKHGYDGYTSYASLDDLTTRASVFDELASRLRPHVSRFAKLLEFEAARGGLRLDSMWINVLEQGGFHAAHIHPHSVISGTYYVAVPKGAGAIRFEDPRLPLMMAAPPRREGASRENRSFFEVSPRPGMLLLWESWLRHDVPMNAGRGQRISVSFNYAPG